ncbi:Bifunctional thiamine biosynthesis protein ThiDN [Candidatus Methanoperedenaceae archaeon GB50]|nr:MAG: Bifunctional thiamine biosynthesis protein ThiDN [Candidatus Methanoperedenaceae archaeon GB50]CAD7772560.1 Bifunctional thiamine biosynthesis protein ThiDN [Candidatus Methanoperedenaceae archaeon GB50]
MLMKRSSLLTIAGSDSGGGAGVQADLKTFAAHGFHGVSVITAVTSQNTLGIQSILPLDEEVVVDQLESVCSDFEPSFAKTGMLYTSETIEVVRDCLIEYDIPFVVDPVMRAETGRRLLLKGALSTLESLIGSASAVTPNRFEAEELTGITIESIDDARAAALKLSEMGADSVIITGGHLDGRDLVLRDGVFEVVDGGLLEGGTHGAGCTYSAALTANLALGSDIFRSARMAKRFVSEAIRSSRRVGHGVAPVAQLDRAIRDAERYTVLESVSHAVRRLEECEECAVLIPEVGSNIAMAVSGASRLGDVAGVEGRIVKLHGRARSVGCIAFGATSHVGRIVLAAMRFDQSLRSAMNIRHSPAILDACRRLNLHLESFSREDEPPGEQTMEWGTAHAFEKSREKPDVIYDRGGVGKEAMIRLLGRDAHDVVERAITIAKIVGGSRGGGGLGESDP